MKSNDISGSSTLVESVDVLRDQGEIRKPLAPRREHVMRRVRFALRDHLPAPVVPLPHEFRIAREGLRSGEGFRFEVFPQPVGAAKRRHAAGGGDAGAGEDRDSCVWTESSNELLKNSSAPSAALVYFCDVCGPGLLLRRLRPWFPLRGHELKRAWKIWHYDV